MKRPMLPEIEAEKAKNRIDFYLTGGSRLVYISRWVLTGIVVVIWLVLWSRGLP